MFRIDQEGRMTENARRLADSVWLIFAARIVSVVGVPMAAWLAAALYGSVQDTNRMIFAMREQIIEMTAERRAIVWRLEQVEAAIRDLQRQRQSPGG